MHAFACKKSAFCRQSAPFFAENRERNPQKRGQRGVFSFREISDVKALAPIFLPTPTDGAGDLPALFRFGTIWTWGLGFDLICVSYPMFPKKSMNFSSF
jgi:hypothetical protein